MSARVKYPSLLIVDVSIPANTPKMSNWFPATIVVPETGESKTEIPITRPIRIKDAFTLTTSSVDYIFRLMYDRVNFITLSAKTINALLYSTQGLKPPAFARPIRLLPYKTLSVEVRNIDDVGTSALNHRFHLEVEYL